MARVPYDEILRNRRLENFVRSPMWKSFEGGRWRRYLNTRVITQCAGDGHRAGYADGDDWHWTAIYEQEDGARRALFPLVEAYAEAVRSPVSPDDEASTVSREDLSDWVSDEFGPEDFDFEVERFTLSEEERKEFAEERAEIARSVREDGWILRTPSDFPPLEND